MRNSLTTANCSRKDKLRPLGRATSTAKKERPGEKAMALVKNVSRADGHDVKLSSEIIYIRIYSASTLLDA